MDNSTLVARSAIDAARVTTNVATLPDCAKVQMVCAPGRIGDLRGQVLSIFSCDLPEKPSLVSGNGFEFAWTSPGRWLAIADGAPETCMAQLSTALADTASLVDVSDAFAMLRMSGADATERLMKLIPIDLGPSAFPSNAVALTHIAHVAVIIINRGPGPAFDVAVPRSFAAAMVDWIAHA